MLKAFKLGAWLPDISPNATDTLITARNVFAGPNGYRPARSFSAITPALDEAFLGGAAFVGSDGTASLLAGTATDLYRFDGADWISVIDSLSAGRWYFAQFGDNVIEANGGELLSYDLLAGMAAVIADAPTATDVATVRDFVFVLEPDGDELTVRWSGFNDSEGWTEGVNQSGSQPLLSGGKGIKVVGGEYGLVLQANAIKRFSYVGGDLVFQVDEISAEVGCMARGSVAQVGRLVFFLSERGFMLCDGNETRPIGNEKVDRTFFGLYSREDIQNISAAVDPRNPVVMWAMPGTPGTLWAYDWQQDRWTTLGMSLIGVFTGFTANISLDALDALYGDLDSIPYSLDDPRFAGGSPLLLIANSSSEIGTMAGDNLPATFKLPNVEPSPGERVRVRSLRPVTDADEVSATIDARARPGDAENIATASSMNLNGEMPIRANGRYLGTTLVIDDDNWTFAQAVEIFCEPAGLR